MANKETRQLSSFQRKWHHILFEGNSTQGRIFDIILLLAILTSVAVVMMESVVPLQRRYEHLFHLLEWIFTILFTIEYIFRIWCSYQPKKYIFSFYGLVDLLCILPSYVEAMYGNTHFLLTIRVLRLMRIFRVFKLIPFLDESKYLVTAIQRSRRKIFVFLFFILLFTMVLGTIMYVIESGKNSDFTSIPISVYWAIVTLTTVGYGDIAPITPLGQAFSALIMIMGYAIIAVPTGIVTVEMNKIHRAETATSKSCLGCSATGLDADSQYCKFCGTKL
ncbi:ion transporter [Chitinophaga silvatica]|uniref:Ion transporter n=1 Tax=Chitinophaga silvatica TaxID=2282649 RepID=A0A3E1Y343_9BACT|nr:ion transporter [Chitinophaga silvatica]RFS19083.1 ion transporter [Chitinophaga silvatica]